MNVFFYRTNWALLLYLLFEPEWEKTFYCFENESQVPSYFLKKDIHYFVFKQNYEQNSKIKWFLGRLKDEIRYWRFVKWLRNIKDKHCFGDDDSLLSKPFIDSNFFVVEDGLANYTPANVEWLQKIGFIGYGCNYKVMGFDHKIHKVLMSGAFKFPKEMINKAVCINIKEMWERKNVYEKEKILDVFNTNKDELEKYRNDYILLTQNYDSYNIKSKENEYSRYVKILKKYPLGKVVIKPHPLSNFDYKKNFPDYKVVKQGIPFELMALHNKYKVLISINSTAAFTVPVNKIIDLYDIDGNFIKKYNLTDKQQIEAEEIIGLVPSVSRPKFTVRRLLRKLYYFVLKKFLWHLD